MSMQVIRTSEKENSPKYIYNYIRCKICLVLRFDFLLWVVKKSKILHFMVKRSHVLDRIKLGEGKEAVKTRPVNCYLTYIVILSSSDETRQGSLISGTWFPQQL